MSNPRLTKKQKDEFLLIANNYLWNEQTLEAIIAYMNNNIGVHRPLSEIYAELRSTYRVYNEELTVLHRVGLIISFYLKFLSVAQTLMNTENAVLLQLGPEGWKRFHRCIAEVLRNTPETKQEAKAVAPPTFAQLLVQRADVSSTRIPGSKDNSKPGPSSRNPANAAFREEKRGDQLGGRSGLFAASNASTPPPTELKPTHITRPSLKKSSSPVL